MIISHERLRSLAADIFAAAGCERDEAERVARYLVEANLAGHDSHGAIRIHTYARWLREGKVFAGKSIRVVLESDAVAVVDGQFGLGQTIGEQAVRLGVEKSSRHGVAVVALRSSGHLGRIGDWPLLAARAGKISLHFVNTSGAGMLVSPHGGIDRRLSANPIAVGVPVDGGEPLILDMSACTIAEGKIRVAFNKGVPVPEGCIIDSAGRPTTDPRVFYADPPGAILPMAGHKGYALSFMIEMLAGALTGGSCTDPKNSWRVANGMLSIVLEPDFFLQRRELFVEIDRFVRFVKSSRVAAPGGEILVPGELEARTRAKRLVEGIELDATTWGQIVETCRGLGVGVK
ncbi:MAG: malate/lactate/ureidoglycolate dehydrogenase [Planctomycetes bacterium]|nr:malate/lactate/ureidoglycolate dehydrogenase [Planctomycetota bacterium]